MVYGNGLENRRGVKATESSNLSLSAKKNTDQMVCIFLVLRLRFDSRVPQGGINREFGVATRRLKSLLFPEQASEKRLEPLSPPRRLMGMCRPMSPA